MKVGDLVRVKAFSAVWGVDIIGIVMQVSLNGAFVFCFKMRRLNIFGNIKWS